MKTVIAEYNPRIESILETIRDNYNYLSVVIDKAGKEHITCLYSVIVQLLPTDCDIVKDTFPLFNVHLQCNNYYSIGFNKPVNWAELTHLKSKELLASE